MSLIHEALEKIDQGNKISFLSRAEAETILSGKEIPVQKEKQAEVTANGIIYWIGGMILLLFILGIAYLLVDSLRPSRGKAGPLVFSPAPVMSPTKPLGFLSVLNHRFSLTGITQVGSEFNAIINNQVVRVGDWVSGARVSSINNEEVTLESGGELISLNLY